MIVTETTTFKAELRKLGGKRSARKIRADGRIPAIIYGHGETPMAVSLVMHDVNFALHHGAHVVNVDVDGGRMQCLIKDVQYGHLGDNLLHLDLTRVDLSERVRVTVGIELKGTPKGTSEGGLLDQPLTEVEIECLVTEIPEVLRPNISELHIGDSLCVRDLELPPSGKPVSNPEEVVATVRALAVSKDAEGEEGEAAEATSAEPEVIGKDKEQEDSES